MTKKSLSEFRQDLVSGEWVLFSTGRAKGHILKKKEILKQPEENCPFENPAASGQKIIWSYPDDQNWREMVIKNK